jgi:hypothetical protein
MSIYPAVQLRSFYSIDLSDSIQIIFEDFSMIDGNSLQQAIQTKKYENVCVVKDKLYINMVNQVISIVGVKLNDSKYMVTKNDRMGITYHLSYDCSNLTMIDGIQLLYHMFTNWGLQIPLT